MTPTNVAVFVAAMLLLSAALVALTIATVRRSVLEPARRVSGRAFLDRWRLPSWLPGPSLDGNPVLWREWHRNRPSRLMRIIWVIYIISSVAGVGIGIHEAIVYSVGRAAGSFTLIIALHLQFLFGLMIVSVQATASLGEERVRGSLDVLLTTPLSTRTIVWGKWLGTYRVVFWLAILPALGSVIVAVMASPPQGLSLIDRIVAPGLVVGEMLAYGAAITSMGLALATWAPRLGRAIAINVVLFVLIAIGWLFFVTEVIWQPLARWLTLRGITDTRWLQDGLLVISPFWAPIGTLNWLLENRGSPAWKFWLLAIAWCALAWAFAAALFWATLRSFDRCLGRMPETRVPKNGEPAIRFDGPAWDDSQLVPSSADPTPRRVEVPEGCRPGER